MLNFNQTQTAPSNQLTIIEIDEETIQFYNQWPLPNSLYVELLNILEPAKPKQVAFAISYNSRNDNTLSTTIENMEYKVIFPKKMAKLPADGTGAIYYYPTIANNNQPSLGVKIAGISSNNMRIPLNFSIDANAIKSISFKDVLSGKFNKAYITNKNILISSSSISLSDIYTMPKYGRVAGSFVHALGYESLISTNQFIKASELLTLILAILLFITLTFSHSNKNPLRTVTNNLLAASLVTIFILTLHQIAGIIFAPTLLYITIICTFILQVVQNIRYKTQTLFLEKNRSEAALKSLKNNDPLTKLPNNKSFSKKLAKLYPAQDNDIRIVMLLSLNSLKEINEIFGRVNGDAALRQIARRLKSQLKGKAFVSRYSDKTFGIIYNKTNNDSFNDLMRNLYRQISAPIMLQGSEVPISIFVGGAITPLHGKTSEILIANAIQALDYARLPSTTNHFIYEESIAQQIRAKHKIKAEIIRAIKDEEFTLYYQPQYNIRSNELIGYEALIRWQDPTEGLRFPDEFIPLAEEFGLIAQIGELVLKMGCHDAMQLPEHLSVAVNISPLQFKNDDIEWLCKKYLKQSGLAAHRLELEITESLMMDNVDNVISTLKRLKNLGIKIAMDDFGTGYSSLQFLTELPFDKIKIDRSFTMKIGKSKQADALITTIIALGHSLEKQVVAEGIESEDMIILLKAAGCHIGQGYHYGRPAPLSEIQKQLEKAPTKSAMAS